MIRKNSVRVRRGTTGAESEVATPGCILAPERLVGLGFRYWMLGRTTGDIRSWEKAWTLYSGTFGLCGARRAVNSLSCWVNTLHRLTQREIEVLQGDCPGFCRDECIAVSMIAACQHNTCPVMRACAFALIETSMIDRVVEEAQVFADTMATLEQRLSKGAILATPAKIEPARTYAN